MCGACRPSVGGGRRICPRSNAGFSGGRNGGSRWIWKTIPRWPRCSRRCCWGCEAGPASVNSNLPFSARARSISSPSTDSNSGCFHGCWRRRWEYAELRRPWTGVLILPLLVGYALATGFGPASLRAVLVAAVFLGGEWIDRPPRPLNSLGIAAVLILAIDTNQLFDLGFQLTFLVVLSILLLGCQTALVVRRDRRAGPLFAPQAFLDALLVFEELRRRVIGLICISCAASLGSLPLMWCYFQRHFACFHAGKRRGASPWPLG